MTEHPRDTSKIDYEALMHANLARVFNEHDSAKRMSAIAELYAEDAKLLEPESEVKGHAAINDAVTALLSSLPPGFIFTATGPAMGHHGLGRLRWQAGPPNGPVAVHGMDVASFDAGLIRSLHVFIEAAGV